MRLETRILILVSLFLSACGATQTAVPEPTARPTGTQTIQSTQQPTITPAAPPTGGTASTLVSSPTVLPTPLQTPLPTLEPATNPTLAPTHAPTSNAALLPAPVYYLGSQSGFDQIWRIDTDGKTNQQVTQEMTAVMGFDVSPVEGKIAYISNNDLIVANPDGSNRKVIVDGPPLPTAENHDRINVEMRQVHWSPDGKWIAYGLGGVNVIDATRGQPAMLKQSDPVPQPPDYQTNGPVKFYWPLDWSPDGTHLMVDYAVYPEGEGLGVLNVSDKKMVDITTPEGYVCCAPTWSADGQSIYYANPAPGMISPGLWHADASTGKTTTLIEGITKTEWRLVGYVHQIKDGTLRYFYATQPMDASSTIPNYPPMTMYQAKADGVTGMSQLRNDAQVVSEAVWLPDGRGALIVDAAQAVQEERYPLTGILTYLKADGSPMIGLPVEGHAPRWGVLSNTPTLQGGEPVLVWEGHTDAGDGNKSDCKRLTIDVNGIATIGRCGEGPGQGAGSGGAGGMLSAGGKEWESILSHFASFEYTTPDERLTFHGNGQLAGPAWQRALAAWARFTYGDLATGHTSAAGRTVLSWWMGEIPGQPGDCGHLVILAYGYAYRNIDPCKGGEVKHTIGGWLTTSEWETFDTWLYGRKAFYGDNSYFNGLGAIEMNQAEADQLAAWAKQVYARLGQ